MILLGLDVDTSSIGSDVTGLRQKPLRWRWGAAYGDALLAARRPCETRAQVEFSAGPSLV